MRGCDFEFDARATPLILYAVEFLSLFGSRTAPPDWWTSIEFFSVLVVLQKSLSQCCLKPFTQNKKKKKNKGLGSATTLASSSSEAAKTRFHLQRVDKIPFLPRVLLCSDTGEIEPIF